MRILSLRLLLAFILCVGFGVFFGYMATAIGNESMTNFDNAIIRFIQGMEVPWLASFMTIFTWIGSGYIVASITVIVFSLLDDGIEGVLQNELAPDGTMVASLPHVISYHFKP